MRRVGILTEAEGAGPADARRSCRSLPLQSGQMLRQVGRLPGAARPTFPDDVPATWTARPLWFSLGGYPPIEVASSEPGTSQDAWSCRIDRTAGAPSPRNLQPTSNRRIDTRSAPASPSPKSRHARGRARPIRNHARTGRLRPHRGQVGRPTAVLVRGWTFARRAPDRNPAPCHTLYFTSRRRPLVDPAIQCGGNQESHVVASAIPRRRRPAVGEPFSRRKQGRGDCGNTSGDAANFISRQRHQRDLGGESHHPAGPSSLPFLSWHQRPGRLRIDAESGLTRPAD